MTSRKLNPKPFIVGRKAALAMCAVEGIYMSEKTKEMFHRFDEKDLSLEDQRKQIKSMARASNRTFCKLQKPQS